MAGEAGGYGRIPAGLKIGHFYSKGSVADAHSALLSFRLVQT
jgi:hypothetical protein